MFQLWFKILYLFLFLIKKLINKHCLAGKGRTGTAICCFLLFSGRFDSVDDVLRYYANKRYKYNNIKY